MKKTLLTTLCLSLLTLAIQAAPVWHLNESFESGIPAGWSQEVLSTDSAGWIAQIQPADSLQYPDGAADGLGRAIMRNSTGETHHYKVRLITPMINLSGADVYQPRLSFYHAQQNRGGRIDTLRVYYRNAATAEWKLLMSFDQAVPDWTLEDTALAETSATYQLAFEVSENLGRGVVLDKVQVRNASQCSGIKNLTIKPMSGSAEISLNSFDASFDIRVSTTALTDPSAADCSTLVFCCADTTAMTIQIPNLTSQTLYYVYVRSTCDDIEEGHTSWVSASFTTSIGFPFAEDFTSATKLPDGWQSLRGALPTAGETTLIANSSSSYGWNFTTTAGPATGNHVWGYGYYSYDPYWLVSPAIDLSDVSADAIDLRFNMALTTSSSGSSALSSAYLSQCHFYLYLSTDDGKTWVQKRELSGSDLSNTMSRQRVILTAYKGQIVKLAFVAHNDSYNASGYFHVDNIQINEYDVQCGDAENLQLTSTTSTISATWQPNGKDSVIVQLSSAASFGDAYILQTDTLTAHSITYSDKSANTAYYVRVKQCCPDASWISKSIKTMMGIPMTHPFSSTSLGEWKMYTNNTAEDVFAGAGLGQETTSTGYASWNITSSAKSIFGMTNAYAPYANIYGTGHKWLVSPTIFIELGVDEAARLTFMQAFSKSSSSKSAPVLSDEDDQFMVLISEDGGTTWSKSNATIWACNDSSDYDLRNVTQNAQKITIDLTKYAGKGIKIAFYAASAKSGSDNYMFVGDINVEKYDANCGGITKLKFAPTYNEVTASWTALGTDSVFAFISSMSTYADTLQQQLAKGASLTFSSLEPNTQYYFAVKQVCSEEWAKSSFKTTCAPETVPYSMDFENEAANGTPSCWTITKLGGSYPYVTTTSPFQGTKCLTWGTNATSSIEYQSWASLPEIDNVNTLQVSFRLRRASMTYDNPDTLMVGVMTDPNDPSTFEMIAEYQPDSTTYQLIELSLASYEGTGKYICFANKLGAGELVSTYYSDYTYYTPFSIDNVEVDVIPTCDRMGAVTASAPTAHGITISYAATNASQYQIIITTEAIRPDTLAQVDSSKVVYNQIVSTLLHKIEDATVLADNTPYYTYVRGVCSESDKGKWSEGATFRTLCDPQTLAEFGTETFDDASHMDCWTLGFQTLGTSTSTTSAYAKRDSTQAYGAYLKLSKESANTSSSSYNDGAYAITPKLNFEGDSINHYQVTFTAATTNTYASNIKKMIVSVVVDPLNPEPDESVTKIITLDYVAKSADAKEYTVSFTDYKGDVDGNFGQYVMFALYEPANHDSTNYVLIDNISISRASTCAQVAEASISDITTKTANFNWESKGAAQYQVLVDTINTRQLDTIAAPIFTAIVDTNMAAITGLSSFTNYYAYVRAICSEGDTAKWSNATAFTTAIGIPYSDPLSDISTWSLAKGTTASAFAGTLPQTPTYTSSAWQTGSKSITGVSGKHAFTEVYNGYNYWLISPLIDMTEQAGENIKMSFDFGITKYTSSSDYAPEKTALMILVSTDDGATWSQANSFQVSAAAGAEYSISDYSLAADSVVLYLSKFAGQKIRIAFVGEQNVSGNDSYFHLANLHIDTVAHMPFLGVSGAEFSNISFHSADMKFLTKASDVATYQYKLCTAGGDTSTVAAVSSTDAEITLSGLNASTTYDVYVRGFSTAGDSCDWVGPISFRTLLMLPFAEDFNSLTAGIPAGWNNSEGTTTYETSRWNYNDSGKDGACVRFNSYSNSSGNTNYLATPAIQFPVLDSIVLSFDYKNPTGGDFTVLVSNNGGTTRDTLLTGLTGQSAWKTSEVDLTQYGGSSVIIYFVGTSNYGSGDAYIYLDNVKMKEIISGCINPDSLTVSDLTANSAVLTFKGDSAKQTIITLSTKSDMSSPVVDTLASGLTYTFSDLQPATTYYAAVQQICQGGNTDQKKINFTTLCAAISNLPWTEDFDSYTGTSYSVAGVIPNCWKEYTTATTHPHVTTKGTYGYVHSGNNSLSFYGGSSKPFFVALPEFADSLHTLQISFWTQMENKSGTLVLGYITANDVDMNSFKEFETYTSVTGSMVQYTTALDLLPDSAAYLAFRWISSTQYVCCIDDIKVEKIPSCKTVKDTKVSAIESHQATISFAPTDADSYEVIVSTFNVDLSKDTLLDTIFRADMLTDTFVVATGLEDNTTYYAYARGLCGTEKGQWSLASEFRTKCDALSLPFDVNFNDSTAEIYCWNLVKKSGTYPSLNSSGYLYFYGGGSTSDMMVALPAFDEDANQLTLALNYKAAAATYSSSTYAKFIVGVMSDLSADSTFIALDTLDYASAATDYELNLSAAPATHKYIAIRYAGGSSSYGAGYIYKVHVEKTPTCQPLKSIMISNVERRSMDIAWVPKDTAASHFELIISPVELQGTALDSAAATAITVLDTTGYHASGLERDHDYFIYCRTNCGVDDGVSTWLSAQTKTKALKACEQTTLASGTATSDYIPVYGLYCDSEQRTQSIYPASMLTDLVGKTISGLKYYVSSGSSESWEDASFDVRMGTTTQANLSSAFVSSSLTTVYSGALQASAADGMTITFDSPFTYNGDNLVIEFEITATSGYTSCTFIGSTVASASRYEYDSYGTVYAYANAFLPKVDFTCCYSVAACPGVDSITVANITDNAATILWKASAGDYANTYDLFYCDSIVTDWTGVVPQFDSIDGLSQTLTGLNEFADYYVYVRANCDAEGHHDGSSNWSAYTTFRTKANCNEVTNLKATLLTKTSAEITWSPTIQTNNFQYILSDSILTDEQLEEATLTASGLTDTTVVLSALNHGTTYYVYVANACGDSHSPYQMTSFITADGCPAVANLHSTTVAYNAVSLAWQRGQFGEETAWKVGYVGGPTQIVSDSSSTIIGLEAKHAYTFFVRAICGEGDTSIVASLNLTTSDLPSPEVLIGGDDATNGYAPVYGSYCDAIQHTQSIYPESMLSSLKGKTITGIKYFVSSGGSQGSYGGWEAESFVITMGITEQQNLSAGWVTETMTEVYNGTLHAETAGGMVITFATPFVYNGGNIVIDFNHPVEDGYSFCNFVGSTVIGASRYEYDSYGYMYEYSINFLPQVQFTCDFDLCAPAEMAASDITTSSAKISWMPGGSETSWEVKNSDIKFAEGQLASLHGDTVTALSYNLNGLKSGTNYYFYARSLCSTGAGAWKMLQFTTEATCFTPAIKDTLDVTATTAYIEWIDTVNTEFAGQYIVAYGLKKGFNLAVDSTFITDTVQLTHTTLTGLTPVTEYSYAVKAACDATDHSFWSSIASFKTECSAAAIPFFYNFNDDIEGTMPECWSKLAEDSTKVASVKAYTPYSATHLFDGTQLLYFADPRGMAILPQMAEPLNQLRITFNHKAEGTSSGNLEVGYITDVNDFATYHALATLQQATAYELAKVNLNGVPDSVAADAHIAIRYVGGSTSYYYFVDDVTVEYLPACAAPGFNAKASINTAVLHLLSTDSAFVEVASDAAFTNVIDTARTSQDSIMLTGLTGGTTYYVRGYSICDSEKSELSNVYAFTTKYGLPFIEEFDLTTTLPANWKQLTGEIGAFTTATYGWTVTSTECAGLGANHLYSSVYYSSYSTPTNKILVTPEIELNAQEGYGVQLSFDLALTDGYSSTAKSPTAAAKANRQFWVLVSTDGGQTWSGDIANIAYNEIDATAKPYTIDLSAYAGQSVKLAFYHSVGSSTSTSSTYIHMDNAKVTEYNPNCLGVTDVMASNITLSGAQIDFSFLSEGQSQAVIAISKTTNPDDAIYMDTLAAGVTTATVTGLDASTTYYALVEQLCEEGATSAWSSAKFATLLGLPYKPVFESTTIPSDWKRYSGLMDNVLAQGGEALTSTTSGWSLCAGDDVITSNHFRGNIYGTTFKYWVVTPTVDMSNCIGNGVILSFDAYLSAFSGGDPSLAGTDDRFAVLVSADGGQTWTKVAEWNNNGTGDYVYNDVPVTGQSYHLDLTPYAGQSIQVAFYGESTQTNADNYFHFGNILIEKVNSTNYSGRVCWGDDYSGGSENEFRITYPNYQTGLNVFKKYTPATEAAQAKMDVLYLLVDSIGETEYRATACLGSLYEDDNFSFIVTKQDAVRQKIYTSVGGCDSTITLYLTIVEPVTKEFFDTICSGDYVEWQGKKIYTRGVYPDTTVSVITGCDSINILYLDVKTAGEAELDRILCYGDTLRLSDGRIITESGIYEEHFKTGLGCDSIVTWYVTALPELASHKNAAISQGESYSDETFQGLTVARHYELTVKSKLGDCDSLVSLNLMIPDAQGMMYDTIFVEQLPYILNGEVLLDETTGAGTYTKTITLTKGEAQIRLVVMSATGLDELYMLEQNSIRKLIINNQLVIIRDGKMFNALGNEL